MNDMHEPAESAHAATEVGCDHDHRDSAVEMLGGLLTAATVVVAVLVLIFL